MKSPSPIVRLYRPQTRQDHLFNVRVANWLFRVGVASALLGGGVILAFPAGRRFGNALAVLGYLSLGGFYSLRFRGITAYEGRLTREGLLNVIALACLVIVMVVQCALFVVTARVTGVAHDTLLAAMGLGYVGFLASLALQRSGWVDITR